MARMHIHTKYMQTLKMPHQTQLSFSRPPKRPLEEVDSNIAPPPPPPKKPAPSPHPTPLERATTTACREITREQAQATVQRLKEGYKDKSGASYPAATTNTIGCTLAQKGTNREVPP